MSAAEQTPAQVLAERITKRLVSEGLLAEGRFPRLSAALAEGKLKESDWRMVLEPPQATVEQQKERN